MEQTRISTPVSCARACTTLILTYVMNNKLNWPLAVQLFMTHQGVFRPRYIVDNSHIRRQRAEEVRDINKCPRCNTRWHYILEQYR